MFDAFSICMLIASLLSSLSTYHQVFCIYKNESVDNISLLNLTMPIPNVILHLIYSVSISNEIFVLTISMNLFSSLILLTMFLYVKNKKVNNAEIYRMISMVERV
jgi:uncharacterized protein with PQ loop repeat